MNIVEIFINLIFGEEFLPAIKPVFLKLKQNGFDIKKTFLELDAETLSKAIGAVTNLFNSYLFKKDVSGADTSQPIPPKPKKPDKKPTFNLKKVAESKIYSALNDYFLSA